MHSTNYFDAFIQVAPDSTATRGTEPPPRKNPSIAWLTYLMIHDHPYTYTSDDVLFTVFADRKGIAESDRPAAREAYFSKGQPCLRASDVCKKYGWGAHFDADGRVALVGVETEDYDALAAKAGKVTAAMRSRR